MAQHWGKEEVIAFLCDGGYEFKMVEHEAVFTMEGMEALNLPFGDEVVKNLFLRDDKKRNYYLVVMPEGKPANLKELHEARSAPAALRLRGRPRAIPWPARRGGFSFRGVE
ncbi:MAG: YbaK/EbsC family protein [Slackia sp.]